MRRGDVLDLDLTDLGYLGVAVGGLPGERARVQIDELKRHYARGRVLEVLSPATERVAPPCPYFGSCGGCQYQHFAYPAHLAWKTEQVRRQLRRVGHFDDPPVRPTIPA